MNNFKNFSFYAAASKYSHRQIVSVKDRSAMFPSLYWIMISQIFSSEF